MSEAATTEPLGYQTPQGGGGRPAGRRHGRTRVALVGGGTVGAAVAAMLAERADFELLGVLVRDAERPRGFPAWRDLVTSDTAVLDEAEVVVEVAGGTGAAADLALEHLGRGKRLVTANKAALAERWGEYLPHMWEGRVYFESAVMAGTPAVGVVSGALRGSRPLAIHGVLSGTCNVVLASMDAGATYASALAEAQRLGYAEADPSLDVGGIDAAHKLTVLARLAFDPDLAWELVRARTSGIDGLGGAPMERARASGRHVRLVASVVPDADGWLPVVRPASLPAGHPLLTLGAMNALLYVGTPLGEVLVRGSGAGGGATASGVMADLLAAAAGASGPLPLATAAPVPAADASVAAGIEEL